MKGRYSTAVEKLNKWMKLKNNKNVKVIEGIAQIRDERVQKQREQQRG